ncbi:MAG: DUF2934 domain-containing protein [Gammaproteobacteria bacterium]
MTTEQNSRIEALAYEIWEQQGRPEGRHEDHWAEAERRLRSQPGSSPTSADSRRFDNEETGSREVNHQTAPAPQRTRRR